MRPRRREHAGHLEHDRHEPARDEQRDHDPRAIDELRVRRQRHRHHERHAGGGDQRAEQPRQRRGEARVREHDEHHRARRPTDDRDPARDPRDQRGVRGEHDEQRHAGHAIPRGRDEHEPDPRERHARLAGLLALHLRRGVFELGLQRGRRVARWCHRERAEQLGGVARLGIEAERASGLADRLDAPRRIARDLLARTRGAARTAPCAARDVAIAVEVLLDPLGDRARGRAELVRLGEHRHAQRLELGRDVVRGELDQARLPESLAREPLEQRRAERVDVRGRADHARIADLLGRHVTRRPEQRAGLRGVGAARDVAAEGIGLVAAVDARDAPVEHVDLAEVTDHDVRRLEIAVHDVMLVRELDGAAHVDERAQQALARPRALRLRQRHAGEPLHREERQAPRVATDLVYGHDRRVLQARLDLRLAQEPRDRVGRRRLAAHPLDRDVAADLVVMAEHDLAHAADAELLAQLVAAIATGSHGRRRVVVGQGRVDGRIGRDIAHGRAS